MWTTEYTCEEVSLAMGSTRAISSTTPCISRARPTVRPAGGQYVVEFCGAYVVIERDVSQLMKRRTARTWERCVEARRLAPRSWIPACLSLSILPTGVGVSTAASTSTHRDRFSSASFRGVGHVRRLRWRREVYFRGAVSGGRMNWSCLLNS